MNDAITDEELMAFADGALAPERAKTVQQAVDAQPELAARVAMFRGTAAALGDFGASQPGDVPPSVLARVQQLSAKANPTRTPVRRRSPIWDVTAKRGVCRSGRCRLRPAFFWRLA